MAEALTVGTFTVDIIAFDLPKVAEPGEVVRVERPIDLYVGGHAANVGIDLVKLGGFRDVVAVGAVGRDVFSHLIERELSTYGVRVYPQVVRGEGTARNVILVVKGEDRRFHIYVGANQHLTPAHVSRAIRELSPKYVYIALGTSRHLDLGIEEVLKTSREVGTLVLIDIAHVRDTTGSALLKALRLADLAHLNRDELLKVTGLDVPDGVRKLGLKSSALITVTLGGMGVVALVRGKALITQPAFSVTPKDPTGAGDAFCAGLLTALKAAGIGSGALDVSDALYVLAYAQAAGAVATSRAGATTAVSGELVERLLGEQEGAVRARTKVAELG